MSKFKVGDKVKRVIGIEVFIEHIGECCSVVTGVDGQGYLSFNYKSSSTWDPSYFELVDDWSIYTNTRPLSELSDEQVGKLLRHNISDGNIGYKSVDGWIHPPVWVASGVYRAKQKSERELFVDEWKVKTLDDAKAGIHIGDTLGNIFDYLVKAPKAGE